MDQVRPTNTVPEWGFVNHQSPSVVHHHRDPLNIRSIFRPHAALEVVRTEARITELDAPMSLRSGNEIDFITQAFSEINTWEVMQGYASHSPSMPRILPSPRHTLSEDQGMSVDYTALPSSMTGSALKDEVGEEGRFSLVADTLVEQFPSDDDACTRNESQEGSVRDDRDSGM